jgi:hypothetical protein
VKTREWARVLMLGIALSGCAQEAEWRPRILVLGIDGADWKVMDPLMEEGFLPNIAKLVQGGSRAHLDCVPAWPEFPCYCPPVWNTVVTGQPMTGHGIHHLNQTSESRHAKTLWDLLQEGGRTSVMASWRTTWPIHQGDDWVLSERGANRAASLVYDIWPGEEGSVEDFDEGDPVQPRGVMELIGLLPHDGERRPSHRRMAQDRISMEFLDRTVIYRTRTDPSLGMPDLTLIILHSPDKSQHAAWAAVQPEFGGPFLRDVLIGLARAWSGPVYKPAPFGFGNVASQYLEADAWLGEHLRLASYDYIVLASDHGMTRADPTKSPLFSGHHDTQLDDAHRGIFLLHGPGVRAGSDLGIVSVLNVAPTIAYLLGLPVGDDQPGGVMREAFEATSLSERPIETVPSWDSPEQAAKRAKNLERLEKLEASKK